MLILGNKFLFDIIILLNFRKSTQGRKVLFFLNIYNITEIANNFNFRIIFFFNFLLIYFLNETNFFPEHLYSDLNEN